MPTLEILVGIPFSFALLVLSAACGVCCARWIVSQPWFPNQIGFNEPDDFVSLFVVLQALPPAVIEGEAIEKPAAQAAIR